MLQCKWVYSTVWRSLLATLNTGYTRLHPRRRCSWQSLTSWDYCKKMGNSMQIKCTFLSYRAFSRSSKCMKQHKRSKARSWWRWRWRSTDVQPVFMPWVGTSRLPLKDTTWNCLRCHNSLLTVFHLYMALSFQLSVSCNLLHCIAEKCQQTIQDTNNLFWEENT